jgi:hypothetical protein
METEVYVFCQKCKAIVDGIGSGDLKDMITCDECNAHITANVIGYFRPIGKEEKRLYFPEDF